MVQIPHYAPVIPLRANGGARWGQDWQVARDYPNPEAVGMAFSPAILLCCGHGGYAFFAAKVKVPYTDMNEGALQ